MSIQIRCPFCNRLFRTERRCGATAALSCGPCDFRSAAESGKSRDESPLQAGGGRHRAWSAPEQVQPPPRPTPAPLSQAVLSWNQEEQQPSVNLATKPPGQRKVIVVALLLVLIGLGGIVGLTAMLLGGDPKPAVSGSQQAAGNHQDKNGNDQKSDREPSGNQDKSPTNQPEKQNEKQQDKSPKDKEVISQGHLGQFKTPQGVIVELAIEHNPWADAVVSFKPGNPGPTRSKNPWGAVGQPNYQGVDDGPGEKTYVALGHGGELVLEFIDNVLVDGPGPDLVIFEIGGAVEPTDVAISEDGKQWIAVGRAGGSKSMLDIGPFVKPGQRFRFVHLTDAKAGLSNNSPWPGRHRRCSRLELPAGPQCSVSGHD